MSSANSSILYPLTTLPSSMTLASSLTATPERLLTSRGPPSSPESVSFNMRRTRDSTKDGDGSRQDQDGFSRASSTARLLTLLRRRSPVDPKLSSGIELETATNNGLPFPQVQACGRLNPFTLPDNSWASRTMMSTMVANFRFQTVMLLASIGALRDSFPPLDHETHKPIDKQI